MGWTAYRGVDVGVVRCHGEFVCVDGVTGFIGGYMEIDSLGEACAMSWRAVHGDLDEKEGLWKRRR